MNEDVTAASARTPAREHVAEEVRALLGRRKMSASELARRLGMSQKYMSRRINGETAFDVDDLFLIAKELGVAIVDLLPRSSEGRVIPTGGTDRGQDQQLNVRKGALTKQPRPTGHPKRTTPHPATRRPVRLSPAHTR